MNIATQDIKSLSHDKRNCLYRLPAIINDLRSLGYQNNNPIPHDDVVYIIEISIGADSRTVRKYIRLLLRHDYLKKLDGTRPIYATKFVQVRTKYTINTTEYKSRTPLGFSFYVFGPRAPQAFQKKLTNDVSNLATSLPNSPPVTPPTESGEGQSQNYMCALGGSHRNEYATHDCVCIEREERERVTPNTHISITEL
jgi:hypothetical protein